MKSYNLDNYLRYKDDVKEINERIEIKAYHELTRDELIAKFLPLVENLARKFSTSDQASGVMDITDMIQEGSIGLIQAVDNIAWATILESDEPLQTLKSFLSKRIKGAIRRAIDINRGAIKLPEHKLAEIRRNPDDDKMVALFFNSIFFSIDDNDDDEEENPIYQIEDKSKKYNINLLNTYLLSLMKQHLSQRQYDVLRLSYGLDTDKKSAKEIAQYINVTVPTANVIVSQIKKEAIDTLISNVDRDQVIDYL
jgi:RNA polymerase sigma factor (sigma-70 family)